MYHSHSCTPPPKKKEEKKEEEELNVEPFDSFKHWTGKQHNSTKNRLCSDLVSRIIFFIVFTV